MPIWKVNFSPRFFLQLSFLPYCRVTAGYNVLTRIIEWTCTEKFLIEWFQNVYKFVIVDYFWTSQSCLLSSNWFFKCRHQFIDKPIIIIEPAVPNTLLLGLGLKLYSSNMQGMLNEVVINSCRIFLKKSFAGEVVQRLLSKHILPPFC